MEYARSQRQLSAWVGWHMPEAPCGVFPVVSHSWGQSLMMVFQSCPGPLGWEWTCQHRYSEGIRDLGLLGSLVCFLPQACACHSALLSV